MPKYLVSYTETNIWSIIVEADSEEEAEQSVREEISINDTQSLDLADIKSFIQVEDKL